MNLNSSNFQRTIIGVYGTSDVGKSTTLALLGWQLDEIGAVTESNLAHWDYRAVFEYQNHKVGIQTYGDIEPLVREGLKHFLEEDCNLIYIASKRYGATVERINIFARDNDFRVIWFAPYEVHDERTPVLTVKDYAAANLLLMANNIIAGRL